MKFKLRKYATKLAVFVHVSFIFFILINVSCNRLMGNNTTEKDSSNYVNYCAGCHGTNLEEFQNRDWMFAKSEKEIFAMIKSGEEKMGMPAFDQAFSDKEIKSLTKYILNRSKELASVPSKEKKFDKEVNAKNINFWAETVISGLDVPWGLEFLPNGAMLITERDGRLLKYSKNKELIQIKGLPPIRVSGQGGLMDVKLHPKYNENGWIYFSYSYFDANDNDKSNTAILRAKLDGDQLINQEIIYKATPTSTKSHHFGSRIEFDNNGYLFFSVGDRGDRDRNPQTLDNSNGKIHRINDDGTIPEDNPFVETEGAIKSIYSYGHRNSQGVTINPATGDIWEHEHGPKGGDEVNLIKPGLNYGWPIISYGINYDGTKFTDITTQEGMEQPIIFYVPSIAPCGMAWVTGNKYPGWENNLLIGSLRFQYLERCKVKDNKIVEQERLLEGIGRVRNVKVSPEGYIYVAIETPGKIIRLVPVDEK